MKSKQIICYNCQREKGVAYLVPRTRMNPHTGKIATSWGWAAEGWKMLTDDLWLCHKCDRTRRCKKCKILLSNLWKCNCGIMHTAYYESHPNYCKECWDKLKK